jgi:hypothetical protein
MLAGSQAAEEFWETQAGCRSRLHSDAFSSQQIDQQVADGYK